MLAANTNAGDQQPQRQSFVVNVFEVAPDFSVTRASAIGANLVGELA
jgi:hypothetical protein